MRSGSMVAVGSLILGIAMACGQTRDGSSKDSLDDAGTGGAPTSGSGGRASTSGSGGRASTSGSGGRAPMPGSGGRSLRDAAPPPPERDATSPGADVGVSPPDAALPDGNPDVLTRADATPSDAPGPADAAPFDALTPVSFARDVAPIFESKCAILGCHTAKDPGTPPLQGMNLDEGAAYINLVNVVAREGQSIGEPTIKRVDAQNPDPNASYLWRKLGGGGPVAGYPEAPPVGWGPRLTPTEKAIVRAWIVQGALDN